MAGRPKGSTNKDTSSVAKKQPEETVSKKEYEAVLKQLEELRHKDKQEKKESMDNPLDMNARITVTSLSTGGVNIKTSIDGTARIFRFERLGQTLPLLYSDLINCINLQRSFFEEGLLYINNEQAVKDNYLEEFYKSFLDIDKINHILDFDLATIQEMLANTTTAIQETIILIVAKKLNNGESLDMNKIDAIEKACNGDINIKEVAARIK